MRMLSLRNGTFTQGLFIEKKKITHQHKWKQCCIKRMRYAALDWNQIVYTSMLVTLLMVDTSQWRYFTVEVLRPNPLRIYQHRLWTICMSVFCFFFTGRRACLQRWGAFYRRRSQPFLCAVCLRQFVMTLTGNVCVHRVPAIVLYDSYVLYILWPTISALDRSSLLNTLWRLANIEMTGNLLVKTTWKDVQRS